MVNFLNGTFIIAIWDKNTDKLLLINDRYGVRPLYYAINNGCFLFGSEVKAILEDKTFKRIVNDEAVFDFFMRGYLLGNKTFFQGITLLPPASILECNRDNFKITQYWSLEFKENYEDLPEDYYISKLQELILQAVQRQINEKHKIGLFLSGGLDSRTIAAVLLEDDRNITCKCLTFGKNPHCDDARYSFAVSRKLGLENLFFTISPDYLSYYSEKIVYMTDGMVPCFNIHAAGVYERMRRYCEIAMRGTSIDTILKTLPKRFFNIDRMTVVKKIYEEFHINFDVNMIRKLLAKGYFSQNKDLAWKSFKEIFKDIKSKFSSNIFSHFNMMQTDRRWIYELVEFARNYFECRSPFLDNELVDFFLNIPPKLRLEANLHHKTFKMLSPDLAKIPVQKTGMRICANRIQVILHRAGQKVLELIFRLIRRISYFRINLHNYRKEYHDYDEWIRKNERVKKYFLDILLDHKTLSRKYFNPYFIKRLIKSHMSGKANYHKQLTSLLTFELWHCQFIDAPMNQKT
jgi:asparagine synthase (glutamine-hydrolysing)